MKSNILLVFLLLLSSLNVSLAQNKLGEWTSEQNLNISDAKVANNHIYIRTRVNSGESINLQIGGAAPQVYSRNNGDEMIIVEYDTNLAYIRVHSWIKDTIANSSNGDFSISRWDVAENGDIYCGFTVSSGLYFKGSNVPSSRGSGITQMLANGNRGWWWYKGLPQSVSSYDLLTIIATDSGVYASELYTAQNNIALDVNPYRFANWPALMDTLGGGNSPDNGLNSRLAFYSKSPSIGVQPAKYVKMNSFNIGGSRISEIIQDDSGRLIVSANLRSPNYRIPNSPITLNSSDDLIIAYDGNFSYLGHNQIDGTLYRTITGDLVHRNGDTLNYRRIVNGTELGPLLADSSLGMIFSNGNQGLLQVHNKNFLTTSHTGAPSNSNYPIMYFSALQSALIDSSYVYSSRSFGNNFFQLESGSLFAVYTATDLKNTDTIDWVGSSRAIALDDCDPHPFEQLSRDIVNVSSPNKSVIVKYDFRQHNQLSDSLLWAVDYCDSAQYATSLDSASICLVTVDSSGQNNVIVWEWPSYDSLISHTDIFRETGSNSYAKIASISIDSISSYVDTSSSINPNVTSYRYMIKHVLNFGSFSDTVPSGPSHKTMHLTSSKGINGEANLVWDSYDGINYPYFYVLRDTSNGLLVIDSVSSGNFTYTDFNTPSSNKAFYIIDVKPEGTCFANFSREGVKNYFSSQSNKSQQDFSTSLSQEAFKSSIRIFPNPTHNELYVNISHGFESPVSIKLYDAIGREIHFPETQNLRKSSTSYTLSLDSLAEGVYSVSVVDAKGNKFSQTILKL